MFQVYNQTNNIVYLNDLRAEIGPKQIVDLTAIAKREDIVRSRDLKTAIHTKRLGLGRQSVVTVPVPPPPEPVNVGLNEEKIRSIIEEVLAKQSAPTPSQSSTDLTPLLETISKKLDSMQSVGPVASSADKQIDTLIDPTKFAELQQKSVQQMTDSIETSEPKKPKTIVIKDHNTQRLVDQL